MFIDYSQLISLLYLNIILLFIDVFSNASRGSLLGSVKIPLSTENFFSLSVTRGRSWTKLTCWSSQLQEVLDISSKLVLDTLL